MRKLSHFIGMTATCLPALGFAIGLGNIHLHSALNQPFDAEINIIDLGSTPLDDIQANLASPEDFKRVGLQRPNYLGNLKFEVIRLPNKTPVVKVTTEDPIAEPVLSFLLNFNAHEGKLLRQYTVFLDPPDYAQMPAMVVAPIVPEGLENFIPPPRPFSGQSGAVATMPTPTFEQPVAVAPSPVVDEVEVVTIVEEPAVAPPVPTKPAVAKPAADSVTYYGPTQAADTLWRVANKVRPANVSADQAMVAIYNANPKAFARHNMNGLKSGYRLRVPAATEMRKIVPADAAIMIQEQQQAWHQRRTQPHPSSTATPAPTSTSAATVSPTKSAASSVATSRTPATAKPAQPASSPTLANAPAAGMEAHLSAASQPTDMVGTDVKTTQAKLALSAEALATARQKNEALMLRIQHLEEQNNTIQQALKKKDQQILTLQKLLSEQPDIIKNAVGSDDTTHPTTATTITPSGAGDVTSPGVTTIPAHIEQVGSQAGEVPITQHSRNGYRLFLFVILLMAGLVLGGIYWQFRRSRVAAEYDDFFPAGDEGETEEEETAKSSETPEDDEPPAVSSSQLNAEQIAKTIEEAGVLTAYGRYQKAEAVLKAGLAKYPGNLDLKIALLENFALARDQAAFSQYARLLPDDLQTLRPDLWSKYIKLQATDWSPVITREHDDINKSKAPEVKVTKDDVTSDISEDDTGMAAAVDEVEEPPKEPMEIPSQVEEVPEVPEEIPEQIDEVPEVPEETPEQIDEVPATPTEMPESTGDTGEAPLEDILWQQEQADDVQQDRTSPSQDDAEESVAEVPSQPSTEPTSDQNKDYTTDNMIEFETGLAAEMDSTTEPESGEQPSFDDDQMMEFDAAPEKFMAADSDEPEDTPTHDFDETDELGKEGHDIGTKLDLAHVYIDMDDLEEAEILLNEVVKYGDQQQQQDAKVLLAKIKPKS